MLAKIHNTYHKIVNHSIKINIEPQNLKKELIAQAKWLKRFALILLVVALTADMFYLVLKKDILKIGLTTVFGGWIDETNRSSAHHWYQATGIFFYMVLFNKVFSYSLIMTFLLSALRRYKCAMFAAMTPVYYGSFILLLLWSYLKLHYVF